MHTCGPSGNWDPENKFLPYRLSPCGSKLNCYHFILVVTIVNVENDDDGDNHDDGREDDKIVMVLLLI